MYKAMTSGERVGGARNFNKPCTPQRIKNLSLFHYDSFFLHCPKNNPNLGNNLNFSIKSEPVTAGAYACPGLAFAPTVTGSVF